MARWLTRLWPSITVFFSIYNRNTQTCSVTVNPLKTNSSNCYTMTYRPHLPFSVSDIRARQMSETENGRLGLYGNEHWKCNHMMTLGFKPNTNVTTFLLELCRMIILVWKLSEGNRGPSGRTDMGRGHPSTGTRVWPQNIFYIWSCKSSALVHLECYLKFCSSEQGGCIEPPRGCQINREPKPRNPSTRILCNLAD